MKKNLPSLLTLLIALALVFAFAACDTPTNNENPTPPIFTEGIFKIDHSATAVRNRNNQYFGYELSYVVSQLGISQYAKIRYEPEDGYMAEGETSPVKFITKEQVNDGIYSVLARSEQFGDLSIYTNVYDGTNTTRCVRYLVFIDSVDEEICTAELVWSGTAVAESGWLTIIIGDFELEPGEKEPVVEGDIKITYSAEAIRTRTSQGTTYYGYELSYVVSQLGINHYAKIGYKSEDSASTDLSYIAKEEVDSGIFSVLARAEQYGDLTMYSNVFDGSSAKRYVRYLVFVNSADAIIGTAELFWSGMEGDKDGWLSVTISDYEPGEGEPGDGEIVIVHSAEAIKSRTSGNNTYYGYELSYVVGQLRIGQYAKIEYKSEDNGTSGPTLTKEQVDGGTYSVLARSESHAGSDVTIHTNVFDGGSSTTRFVRYLVFVNSADEGICTAELIWSGAAVAESGWLTIIISDYEPGEEDTIEGDYVISHSAEAIKSRTSGNNTYYGYELSYVVGQLGIGQYAKIEYKSEDNGTPGPTLTKEQVDGGTYSVLARSESHAGSDVTIHTNVFDGGSSTTRFVRYLVFIDSADAVIGTAELIWSGAAVAESGWLSVAITTP